MTKKLLVVDDDPQVRRLLTRVLGRMGYDVLTGDNGLEAVTLADTARPHLILMDLDMPKMDGSEAIRRIRGNPDTAGIPVLVLTGKATRQNIIRARKAGALDFVVKSEFNMAPFLEKIETALGATKPASEVPARGGKDPEEGRRKSPPSGTKQAKPAHKRSGTSPGKVRAKARKQETREKLEKALQSKALPPVAAGLARESTGRTMDARHFAKVIERDRQLAGRVLALFNAAFGALHGRIRNLTQAIDRVGFRGIRELALAAALIREYGRRPASGGLGPAPFWKHSLACAVLARDMACAAGEDPEVAEDAFLVGLLHDAGRLLLDDGLRAAYGKVVTSARKLGKALHDRESRTLGMDHAGAGELLLRKWRFPSRLLGPVALHHADWKKIPPPHANSGTIVFVQIANVLAKAAGIGAGGDATLNDVPDEQAKLAGLNRTGTDTLLESARKQADELSPILLQADTDAGSDPEGGGKPDDPPSRPEVVLLRESDPVVDPVELFLRQGGFVVRVHGTLDDVREKGAPDAMLIRTSSAEWIQDVAHRAQTAGSDGPTANLPVGVLAQTPVGRELKQTLTSLGWKVIPKPYGVTRIAEILPGSG